MSTGSAMMNVTDLISLNDFNLHAVLQIKHKHIQVKKHAKNKLQVL